MAAPERQRKVIFLCVCVSVNGYVNIQSFHPKSVKFIPFYDRLPGCYNLLADDSLIAQFIPYIPKYTHVQN